MIKLKFFLFKYFFLQGRDYMLLENMYNIYNILLENLGCFFNNLCTRRLISKNIISWILLKSLTSCPLITQNLPNRAIKIQSRLFDPIRWITDIDAFPNCSQNTRRFSKTVADRAGFDIATRASVQLLQLPPSYRTLAARCFPIKLAFRCFWSRFGKFGNHPSRAALAEFFAAASRETSAAFEIGG